MVHEGYTLLAAKHLHTRICSYINQLNHQSIIGYIAICFSCPYPPNGLYKCVLLCLFTIHVALYVYLNLIGYNYIPTD